MDCIALPRELTVLFYLLYTQSMNRAPTRLWDFPSAALLILILLTASQGLVATHWAPGLGTAIVLALIGVVLGLALGASQFKREAVFWLSFGYQPPDCHPGAGLDLVCGDFLAGTPGRPERSPGKFAGLFFTSQPVQDTVLFVVFMALVFWIIGLLAGFALTRFGNFIGAVVPCRRRYW